MSYHIKRFAYLSIGASILTLILKYSAYFITGSVGLFSDATESVVNLMAGIVALTAIIISLKPADDTHTYGHGKVEYFSGGMEGFLIILAALGIAYASIRRFISPVELQLLGPGIGVAIIASVVNYITAKIMLRASKEYDSLVLEADAKHLFTDVWTSAGIVVGLGVIYYAPKSWQILDPIIAIVMAVNISKTGFELVSRSMHGLLDRGLPDKEIAIIEQAINTIVGAKGRFHGLRTRKSGRQRFVDFHLLVPGDLSVQESHDLCCDIEDEIHRALGDVQITIHVEPKEDHASWDGDTIGGRSDDMAPQG